MYAADFRQKAKDALSGKWGIAVGTALVASLMGAENFPFQLDIRLDSESMQLLQAAYPRLFQVLLGLAAWTITLGIIAFFLGGVINLGYCKFQLTLLDGKPAQLSDLFSQFHRFWGGFCLSFLTGLFVTLWSLFLIIPGIVAAYSYAMAPYIMLEDPQCTASEALARSKMMMQGYKGRLFCLEFSFLGWNLLSALTLGIGYLWINPYTSTSIAAFYRWRAEQTAGYSGWTFPPSQT